jgi:hypothetical protein
MNVPEITEVKNHLDELKNRGLLGSWELPYENILTRRSAAIFFLTPASEAAVETLWRELEKYDNFSHRRNEEKRLSRLEYRITFSKEEKEKNQPAELALQSEL